MASESNPEQDRQLNEALYFSNRPRLPKTGYWAGGEETAFGRRRMRQIADWDKRHEMKMQMEEAQREAEMGERKYAIERENADRQKLKFETEQSVNLAKERQSRMAQEQAATWAKALDGSLKDEKGNPFILDPNSPDYLQKKAKLAQSHGLGLSDDSVDSALKTSDSLFEFNKQMGRFKPAEIEEISGEDEQEAARIAEESGRPLSDFVTTSPKTGKKEINRTELGRAQGRLKAKEPTARVGGLTEEELNSRITSIEADMAEAEAAEDIEKLEGLRAKKDYYQSRLPKSVESAAEPSNIQVPPRSQRKAGDIYPTPIGKRKWTGTGWAMP
jgi:hypothetical protein